MKLLLTRFTYDPLSITQMDTTFCYRSRHPPTPPPTASADALAVFHLVTSPLVCVIPLMVSVVVDGIINLRLRPVIITAETY